MALTDQFWMDEAQRVFTVVEPIVEDMTKVAMEDAVQTLIDLGFDFDASFINEMAVKMAHEYSFALVMGITKTSRNFVSGNIEDWIISGEPLEVLLEKLAPMFGDVRANMIGVTEVTRIFADANRDTWKKSGYVRKVKFMTVFDELVCEICAPHNGEIVDIDNNETKPPLHTKCRCFEVPQVDT